ncbi:hypothetical protein L226DRAFT_535764 [Lentinus tigrinus ALCF2SS1-7]|uniref:uncharacterized protein n=1 Tax=Lentinus tigrinus ALCF2SS1-7 TaxID=1328758 RepID=UPI0011661743|nr:hypothetical protein L226DRAFT_535764 [Lentinus tigrinus ALCF2SS1-7]
MISGARRTLTPHADDPSAPLSIVKRMLNARSPVWRRPALVGARRPSSDWADEKTSLDRNPRTFGG